MIVKVYTQQNCSECERIKKFLESRKIDYVERNIDLDIHALKDAMEMGVCKLSEDGKTAFCMTPAIEVGDNLFIGFNEKTIKELEGLK